MHWGCRGKYSLSRPHSGAVGTSVRSTRSSGALPRNPARRGRLCGEHSCAEGGKVIVPHSPCNPCSRGSVVPHSSPEPPPARRGRSPRPCTLWPCTQKPQKPSNERFLGRSLLDFLCSRKSHGRQEQVSCAVMFSVCEQIAPFGTNTRTGRAQTTQLLASSRLRSTIYGNYSPLRSQLAQLQDPLLRLKMKPSNEGK